MALLDLKFLGPTLLSEIPQQKQAERSRLPTLTVQYQTLCSRIQRDLHRVQ